MAWDVGTRLTSELTLLEPLAEGAMGELWIGEHAGLGCRVAVKFLSPKLVSDKAARGRFRREAEAAMQLQSPYVVRLYGHGTTDGRHPYLVFELLEGESLGTLLVREERLDLAETMRLVRQVGSALSEAHAHGIVHRDIKADNVFVIESPGGPVAKVLDFGMAKRTQIRSGSVVTATGVIVGTPEYMSPEQVLGSKQLDHRTDLWSLGVLTYRALLGAMPFDAAGPGELVFAICRGQFRRPSELYLPKVLDGWFEQALAPELDARFASAAELVLALERIEAMPGLADTLENALCNLPTMVKAPAPNWREQARAMMQAKRGRGPGSLSSVARRAREALPLAKTVASSAALDADTEDRLGTQQTVARAPSRKEERRTLRYVRPQASPASSGAGVGVAPGGAVGRGPASSSDDSRPSVPGPGGAATDGPVNGTAPGRHRTAHPTLRSVGTPAPDGAAASLPPPPRPSWPPLTAPGSAALPPPSHPSAAPPSHPSAGPPSYPSGPPPRHRAAERPSYPSGPPPRHPAVERPSYPSGPPPRYPAAERPSHPSAAPPSQPEAPPRPSRGDRSTIRLSDAGPPSPPPEPSAPTNGRSLPPWSRPSAVRGWPGSKSTGGPTVVLGGREGSERGAHRKMGYGVAMLVVVAIATGTALAVGAMVLASVDEPAADPLEADVTTARDEPPEPSASATSSVAPPAPGSAPATVDSSAGTSVEPSAAAPESAPTAPRARPGYLTLDCKPACTQVIVEGRSLGPSPVAGALLTPGRKQITLKRRGHEPQTVELEIRSGQVTRRLVVAR